jgi:hypothetical protein
MPKDKPHCDRCWTGAHRTASVVLTVTKPQGTVTQTVNLCDVCAAGVTLKVVNRQIEIVEPKREPERLDMVAFAAAAAGFKSS